MTEVPGSGDNPAIINMARVIGDTWPEQEAYSNSYKHDDTAWCGLTVAYCVTQAGIKPVFGPTDTDKWLWAESWSRWPNSVHLDRPRLGCIVVFRWDSGSHHVTLYESTDGSNYRCRGGNQGDMVNVTAFPARNAIALVWPGTQAPPSLTLSATELMWVQSSLNVVDNAGLDVDGEYGPLTHDAITSYQRKNDIAVTGTANQETVDELLGDLRDWNYARTPEENGE